MDGFYLKNKKYFYSSKTNTIINKEIEALYSKNTRLRDVKIEDVAINEESIRVKTRDLRQLVIETNQSCNMNCRYCSYASKRYRYQRTPSTKSISFNSIKRTIKCIYDDIKDRDKREFTIGFYGGEPLLSADMIKRTVNYSRKVFQGWELRYTIATNGTLLTEDIIRYFAKNKFYILLSMDGPK